MERADVYVWQTDFKPKAVLILCPGVNGNGGNWVRERAWQDYAKKEQFGLAGLSFASPMRLLPLGRGYYYAGQGSGQALLACLRQAYGEPLPPLLLFGFSGGAHFTARFAEWMPERIAAWCAYSAAWWDDPLPDNNSPPGIVACGKQDERLQATLDYFYKGRELGNKWLWVELPRTGHERDVRLEEFVRLYFLSVVGKGLSHGIFIGLNGRQTGGKAFTERYVHDWGWLPDEKLMDAWIEVTR